MLEVIQARGSITGRNLRQALIEKGLVGEPIHGLVSYGVRLNTTKPALNANAGARDKYEELLAMREAGLLVPPFSLDGHGLQFPILGRKKRHTQGRDIIPILQNDQEFEQRKQGGHCDFFVQYIPRETEFRVWVYRRRHLGTYEKVFTYPEKYKRIGCSADNGFAFKFVDEPDEELKRVAAKAVDALSLDFGAVDILKGKDGNYYALEVNTAPGVEGPRHGFTKLVEKIARWCELGFPERKRIEPLEHEDGEQGTAVL